MRKGLVGIGMIAGMLAAGVSSLAAQALEAGAMAPDFEIQGATRFGVLAEPVKLSDFKGKTVVVAFFPRARTRG